MDIFNNIDFRLPSPSLFSFPPTGAPPASPPAPGQPFFDIPDHIYEAALNPKVPLTIAALYAITAKALNAYNTSRDKKPWRISKTKPFKTFVIAHNVFLAIYSAWTFVGMFQTLRRGVVSPLGPEGVAGTVDSFCKLQGTEGLGNANYYDESVGAWTSSLSRSDSGRIWNEGLAYYGWWFYLSKFYEVFDTFIILAKGRLSSTLQTYHHAGAMMCMWAGIRYMSAPIWMFVFVNSGIHAMMYTYYTVTAFNIKVPMAVKRTLTTCQITQFLIGASYAMIHSFVNYTVPVSRTIESTAFAAADSDNAAPPAASAAGAALDNIKNMIWGASSSAAEAGATPVAGSLEKVVKTVTHYETVPCITTKGETFAIWLNVVYLAPLTYLFVSFFISSYIRRSAQANKGKKNRRMSSNVEVAEKAGWDAATNVGREVYTQGVEAPVAVSSEEDEEVVEKKSPSGKARIPNGKAKKVPNGGKA
ncbi:putative gns1 sur4 family protein [Zalerion maritima]|uniref:Elongation of fatty acids protein n=1 Tax=Zalerion maritima TaxID=339359 RepID=A0AAD5RFZ6_9PEZI|nr:putative gns1 sur4 family protein [Zalerion maritima]